MNILLIKRTRFIDCCPFSKPFPRILPIIWLRKMQTKIFVETRATHVKSINGNCLCLVSWKRPKRVSQKTFVFQSDQIWNQTYYGTYPRTRKMISMKWGSRKWCLLHLMEKLAANWNKLIWNQFKRIDLNAIKLDRIDPNRNYIIISLITSLLHYEQFVVLFHAFSIILFVLHNELRQSS